MDFQFKALTLAQAATEKADALIVLVSRDESGGKEALAKLIATVRKAGDLPAKAGEILSMYRAHEVAAPRLVLAAIDDGKPAAVRNAVAAAMAALKPARAKRVVVAFASAASQAALRAAVMASAEAGYVYTATKSKPEPGTIRHVVIGMPDAPAALAGVFAEARAAVAGIELAKEWGNRPGNHCTPALLAQAAEKLADLPNVHCRVLGPKEVQKLGMGAFIGVAKGSDEPLRFIELRYQGGAKSQAPVVLVGKGITFDSGGVSLKPAAEMDEMKFDMCGAASVLGVFRALGELRPAVNVVGLIPACENMNDGHAIKPGDVLTSMSGQTIEVLNTDAEGRLILCDALAYAQRFSPAAVIDIATLTGACMVALGSVRSGLFASDDMLAAQLQAAGEEAIDPCWRMPLDDEYADGLKSKFADVANVAGRAGGAVTAAKFLQKFAGDAPWAHLDIAGTAWKSGAAKGATGRPVALLLRYLLARVERQETAPKTSARRQRSA